MLVNVLRLTCRYLMLSLSISVFETILHDFWAKNPPQQFASDEALNFIQYLKLEKMQFLHLEKLIEFEEAILMTLLDGEIRVITFEIDPFPLLRALTEGRLPTEDFQVGNFEIELTPDNSFVIDIVNLKAFFSYL